MDKKRVIVDYKNVPENILEAIAIAYPEGYDHAITKFKNAKGENVRAIRVETEDTIYLVKVSVELAEMVEDIDPDDEDLDDSYDVGGEARDFAQRGGSGDDEEDRNSSSEDDY